MNNIYLKFAREESRRKALEIENEKLKANTDYIAMMTDVDIPTDESEVPDAQSEI